MFVKKMKLGESHQGIEIVSLFILSKIFGPYADEKVEVKATIFLSLLMFASLITCVVLVRRNTNREKLFQQKPTLSPGQQIIFVFVLLSFVYEYVVSGNFQSFLALFSSKVNVILACFMVAAGAAISEEYLIRGYLFNLVQRILSYFGAKRNQLLVTALITSVLFALFHLVNLFTLPKVAVYEQVLYCFADGLLFSAIRIATNRIYIAALFHFIFDFTRGMAEGLSSVSFGEIIIYFVPSLLISALFIILINSQMNRGELIFLKP